MKLDLLRQLLDLNQAFEQVIGGLHSLENVPFFQSDLIQHARAEVETARVDTNREFFDHLSEIVENDARWAYKFIRDYDRKTKDPFDFYLELKDREEKRKKKGLPPKAVLLPGWDEDDDPHRPDEGARKDRRAVRRRRTRSKSTRRTARSQLAFKVTGPTARLASETGRRS